MRTIRPARALLATMLIASMVQSFAAARPVSTNDAGQIVDLVVRRRNGIHGAGEAIAKLGAAGVPPILALLSGEMRPDVPVNGPLIDRPTRQFLMESVAGWTGADVMRELSNETGRSCSLSKRLIAIELAGLVADHQSLDLLFDLFDGIDPAHMQHGMILRCFETSIAQVLERDRRTLATLAERTDEIDAVLVVPLARAVGKSGNPKGLAFVQGLLRRDDALDAELLATIAGWPKTVYREDDLTAIAACLVSSKPAVRNQAAAALGGLGATVFFDELLQLTYDADKRVQHSAHWALQQLSGLRWTAENERWYEWHASEEAWFDQNVERLVSDVMSNDIAVAVEALRELGSHPVFAHELAIMLRPALRHADENVAIATCAAFVRLRVRDVEGLLSALDDGRKAVRDSAAASLFTLTGQVYGDDVDAWRAWAGS